MKKVLLALVALTFLFSACEKEGIYAPKKKIKSVYYQNAGDEQKELLESYQWDGNKLKSRTFRYSILNQYEDDFEVIPTYKGKRVVRADEKISGDYVEYIYEGKLLTKLSYHSGDYYADATVEHKDGKISRIFFPAKSASNYDNKFLRMFLSPDEITTINQVLQKSEKTIVSRDVELLYTWDGDNVSGIKMNGYDGSTLLLCYESKFKYDNMVNPFAVNWSDLASQSQVGIGGIDALIFKMSKNNITQINGTQTAFITPEFPISQSSVSNITYEYDGKYPMKATHTDEEGNISGTYHYEYLK